jgi:hypothetical protein
MVKLILKSQSDKYLEDKYSIRHACAAVHMHTHIKRDTPHYLQNLLGLVSHLMRAWNIFRGVFMLND